MFVKLFDRQFTRLFYAPSEWWKIIPPVVAYQPVGSASLADSYVNLANPGTYDAALGVAPTWDVVNGWIFNGSSQYLNTGFLPDINTTIIIKYSNLTDTVVAQSIAGAYVNSASRSYMVCYPTYTRYNFNDKFENHSVAAITSGVRAINKDGGFYNGTKVVTFTGAAAQTAETPIVYIGAYNKAGSADDFAGVYVQSFGIYAQALTTAQILSISNAMEAI